MSLFFNIQNIYYIDNMYYRGRGVVSFMCEMEVFVLSDWFCAGL